MTEELTTALSRQVAELSELITSMRRVTPPHQAGKDLVQQEIEALEAQKQELERRLSNPLKAAG